MMMSEERLNMLYNQQKYGGNKEVYNKHSFSIGRFLTVTTLPLSQPILLFFIPIFFEQQTGDSWGGLAALFIAICIIFTIGLLMDLIFTVLSIIGIQKESKAYILPLCINALLLITKSICLVSVFAGGL